MEYAYAALLLTETGAELNERNLTAVLETAGADVDRSRVEALVAATEDVDLAAVAAGRGPVDESLDEGTPATASEPEDGPGVDEATVTAAGTTPTAAGATPTAAGAAPTADDDAPTTTDAETALVLDDDGQVGDEPSGNGESAASDGPAGAATELPAAGTATSGDRAGDDRDGLVELPTPEDREDADESGTPGRSSGADEPASADDGADESASVDDDGDEPASADDDADESATAAERPAGGDERPAGGDERPAGGDGEEHPDDRADGRSGADWVEKWGAAARELADREEGSGSDRSDGGGS